MTYPIRRTLAIAQDGKQLRLEAARAGALSGLAVAEGHIERLWEENARLRRMLQDHGICPDCGERLGGRRGLYSLPHPEGPCG